MCVYKCLADGIGLACCEAARILSDVASIFLGVHLGKDGCIAVIASDIACGAEPMAETCRTGCGGCRAVTVGAVGTCTDKIDGALHVLA